MQTKRVYKFRADNSLVGFHWIVPRAYLYVREAAVYKYTYVVRNFR